MQGGLEREIGTTLEALKEEGANNQLHNRAISIFAFGILSDEDCFLLGVTLQRFGRLVSHT